MPRWAASACAGLALAALAGCASDPFQGARTWKIESCAQSIDPTLRFTTPGAIVEVPRSACAAVVRAAAKIELVAKFQAEQLWIADPEFPNAAATTNSAQRPIIIVTVGLLQALGDDEAAWAALLGHEVAHHVKNHRAGRESARTQAWVAGQAVGNLIGAFVPGVGGLVAANVANFAASSAVYGSYTRPQEAEADKQGLDWMVAAGYDPRGMERLIAALSKSGGAMPGFLSTHPGADDRAQMVRTYIEKNRGENR